MDFSNRKSEVKMTKRVKGHLADLAESVGAPPPNLTEASEVARTQAAGGVPAGDPQNLPAAVKTMSVPDCGWLYFGLGRNASYEAAKRGDIPTIRIGRLLRAVPSVLDRRLAEAGR